MKWKVNQFALTTLSKKLKQKTHNNSANINIMHKNCILFAFSQCYQLIGSTINANSCILLRIYFFVIS